MFTSSFQPGPSIFPTSRRDVLEFHPFSEEATGAQKG